MNQSEEIEMLMRVSNFLEEGKRNFPVYSKHFDQCFKNIKKEAYSNYGNRNQERKKDEIKDILQRSLIDYEEMNEEITDEEMFRQRTFTSIQDFINYLQILKRNIDNAQKRVTMLSELFGMWLSDAEKLLNGEQYKTIMQNSGYTQRYCKFLVWLHKLCKSFPKMKCSSAPIRTFLSNQKIIEEICQEDYEFWSSE